METIRVQKRDGEIKAKKLRRMGFIPGNVIGNSLSSPVSVKLKKSDADNLVRHKREGSKVTLDIDGTRIPVQIKEKDMDTLKGEIRHIGFQALKADEKVNSVIHVLLTNDDKIPGQLEKLMMEIPYTSLPADMIDTVTVDLDGITTGTVLMVKDIPELISDKIELQVNLEEVVLRVSEKRYYQELEAEESEA